MKANYIHDNQPAPALVLSLQQRTIYRYVMQGYTPAAIAAILGTPEKAVAIQIQRMERK